MQKQITEVQQATTVVLTVFSCCYCSIFIGTVTYFCLLKFCLWRKWMHARWSNISHGLHKLCCNTGILIGEEFRKTFPSSAYSTPRDEQIPRNSRFVWFAILTQRDNHFILRHPIHLILGERWEDPNWLLLVIISANFPLLLGQLLKLEEIDCLGEHLLLLICLSC